MIWIATIVVLGMIESFYMISSDINNAKRIAPNKYVYQYNLLNEAVPFTAMIRSKRKFKLRCVS